jgi:sugar O-acyltransferase (sialic acid O-acetyltransferase NeuD family)
MSTDKKLVIIGGGEHGRVVAETALSSAEGWNVLGFVDEAPCPEMTARFALDRLGDDSALRTYSDSYCVLGFGAFKARDSRAAAVKRIDPDVAGWATIIHRTAVVSPTASVGKGTVIMAAAVVQTGATIGDHCIINTGAVVEHDTVVEDYVQIGPGAVVGGGVFIGKDSFIGLGASVRDHVRIGAGSVVGMGAAAVGNVAGGSVVRGVPAR